VELSAAARHHSVVDDATLLEQFGSCELPRDAWCHRLHIRVAYLFIRRYDSTEALRRLRAGIQAYNRVVGVTETLTSGYHETLTAAWFSLVSASVKGLPAGLDSNAFCAMHPELLDKGLIRKFYSRERIVSQQAKREFVEPDLAVLPPVE